MSDNIYLAELQNRYVPLRQQGSEIVDRVSEHLTSGILRGGSSSAASSGSKGSRGRKPIPLTPEILLLLDRLEPDKGKQARLLTEHLTGQRTLPGTEQELQKLMERKAEKEISGSRRQRKRLPTWQHASKWKHTRWLWQPTSLNRLW